LRVSERYIAVWWIRARERTAGRHRPILSKTRLVDIPRRVVWQKSTVGEATFALRGRKSDERRN
jgi:hypothetical protein